MANQSINQQKRFDFKNIFVEFLSCILDGESHTKETQSLTQQLAMTTRMTTSIKAKLSNGNEMKLDRNMQNMSIFNP